MMDGRIKTLHPKIHGALLAIRDNFDHLAAMENNDIEPIDLVVVNLYPFAETIARDDVTVEQAIEQIDIGGPAMIRSAAKNYRYVTVLTYPDMYAEIVTEMKANHGSITLRLREKFAAAAFTATFAYDGHISQYLWETLLPEAKEKVDTDPLSYDLDFTLEQRANLRYGENPHQRAALYTIAESEGIATAEQISGKEMSFNNYVDADAAWQLVCDFESTACAIIKHTNPAGCALGANVEEAYRRALACDPVSAFGGIVAFNRKVDAEAARAVIEIFSEVIIAPDYEDDALEALKTKKNLRVLSAGESKAVEALEYKQISGGMLVQTSDTHRLRRDDLKIVSQRQLSEKEIDDLLFAWTVCKHTKSNAIVYARDKQTVGVGAGQMSRVDSVKIGAMRAQLPIEGSVLASDAFFPFRDGIDEAAKHGIVAVIQPGGSVRDEEVIAAANEHNLAMVFTGVRHFKH